MKISMKFLPLIVILFLTACGKQKNINIENVRSSEDKINNNTIGNFQKQKVNIYIDFLENLTDTALQELTENKSVKKNYIEAVASYKFFYTSELTKYEKWNKNNSITGINDTSVLYAFGGPDLPTVVSLFPDAKNFISFGLENPGTIFNPQNLTPEQAASFFENINKISANLYKLGYFNTNAMKYAFRQYPLDGVVGLLGFYAAQYGDLKNAELFTIDKYGTLIKGENKNYSDKRIKGVKITFADSKGNIKNFYYLRINVADENLKDYSEFFCFINKMHPTVVFIKSASYLLQTQDFELLKAYLSGTFPIILQDDSGFDYNFLLIKNYKIEFYGNYIRPQKIFSEKYDTSLASAVKNYGTKPLNFKFGYNKKRKSLLLMLARKDTSQNFPVFKVQFAMRWNKYQPTDTPYLFLPDVDYYIDEGYYKYTAGKCSSVEECIPILLKAKELGFKDAFMVKFDRNKRTVIENPGK